MGYRKSLSAGIAPRTRLLHSHRQGGKRIFAFAFIRQEAADLQKISVATIGSEPIDSRLVGWLAGWLHNDCKGQVILGCWIALFGLNSRSKVLANKFPVCRFWVLSEAAVEPSNVVSDVVCCGCRMGSVARPNPLQLQIYEEARHDRACLKICPVANYEALAFAKRVGRTLDNTPTQIGELTLLGGHSE